MTRLMGWIMLAILIAGGPSPRTGAAEANAGTPTRALPVLLLRATDTGFSAPAETVAGWQRVRLENETDGFYITDLMLLPPEKSIEDFFYETDVFNLSFPAWFNEIVFAGSPVAFDRGTFDVVVKLTPGNWWIVYSIGGDTMPIPLSVDPGPSSVDNLQFPDPVVTTLAVSGLRVPEDVSAGPRWWRFVAEGGGIHAPCIARLPKKLTAEQLKAHYFAGTPIPGFRPSQVVAALQVGYMSSGQTTWVELDLAPGSYEFIDCGVDLDRSTWARKGSLAVFTVKAQA